MLLLDLQVSIPFIAGQWSLLLLILWALFMPIIGFNPLHCGAVVASYERYAPCVEYASFQSPSLRGSGRFVHTVHTSTLSSVILGFGNVSPLGYSTRWR